MLILNALWSLSKLGNPYLSVKIQECKDFSYIFLLGDDEKLAELSTQIY